MKPLRHSVIGLILLVAVAAALFGVNRVGLELEQQAVESWLQTTNASASPIQALDGSGFSMPDCAAWRRFSMGRRSSIKMNF
jgi:hypothetical protein